MAQNCLFIILLWGCFGWISAEVWHAHVCCKCTALVGDESFSDVQSAQAALRAIDRSKYTGATITIQGECQVNSTLKLTSDDGGSSTFPILYHGTSDARIVGGPAVLRQDVLPNADGSYRVDFKALGIIDLGEFHRHEYLGGSACVNLYLENVTGLELVYWPQEQSIDKPQSWMHFARFPNADVNINEWSELVAKLAGHNRFVVDNQTAARLATWQQEMMYSNDARVHGFWNGIGWADATRGVVQVWPNATMHFEGTLMFETYPGVGGYFYTYNLRSEMDRPGEMYINRSGGYLDFIPPAVPTMPMGTSDRIGYLTIAETLVELANVSFVTFDNIEFAAARGAGIAVSGGINNTFSNLKVHHVGMMGINVTNSPFTRIVNSSVYATGSGGINLHGGDRQTLQPSSMLAQGNDVYEYTRVTTCYVAGINLGGVGQRAIGNTVHHADHMALFLQGNDHIYDGNVVHDVTRTTRDSGAFYMGRDWTYRGNRIVNNLFYNINSVFNRSKGSPNSVHAVYLDDSGSGFYIANNTFRNVTNAFMLGGGRDNHFVNNTIDGCGQGGVMPGNKHLGTPIYFDNRDMGWASKNCNQSDLKDATLIQFLYRVPYNETPYTKYEHLANILEDHPCVPKYNNIRYRACCHAIVYPRKNRTILMMSALTNGLVISAATMPIAICCTTTTYFTQQTAAWPRGTALTLATTL
eukprot:TRINITY_DN12411_c0_g2_i5.p1 TRINITY_DN12411_c0_g2~~TRINITY_DN12411_c0_g2_i5.p1  ORF type:complete len:697 (+),score=110.92 TRINITY_DN12411_c0_g2_i5:2-2092(+)